MTFLKTKDSILLVILLVASIAIAEETQSIEQTIIVIISSFILSLLISAILLLLTYQLQIKSAHYNVTRIPMPLTIFLLGFPFWFGVTLSNSTTEGFLAVSQEFTAKNELLYQDVERLQIKAEHYKNISKQEEAVGLLTGYSGAGLITNITAKLSREFSAHKTEALYKAEQRTKRLKNLSDKINEYEKTGNQDIAESIIRIIQYLDKTQKYDQRDIYYIPSVTARPNEWCSFAACRKAQEVVYAQLFYENREVEVSSISVDVPNYKKSRSFNLSIFALYLIVSLLTFIFLTRKDKEDKAKLAEDTKTET